MAWVNSLGIFIIRLIVFRVISFGEFILTDFYENVNIRVDINVNFCGFVFLNLLILVALIVFIWRRFYIANRLRLVYFYLTFRSFVRSIVILLVGERFFVIFMGWEGLGVSSFILIIFFQNWQRQGGGLLTILTNRIGDAVLLIIFCFWLMSYSRALSFCMNAYGVCMFLFLAFTKRAQWPFNRWLPAAMAAPTPVRALVHSSTLVTAGIWLLLRFFSANLLSLSTWMFFGGLTLILASIRALMEKDSKKVVALSTLRQLGVIVLALRIRNYSVCFFHIIIHALAKANLFLVVGNILHFIWSQQDARKIGLLSNFLISSAIIRIIRLSGILFSSGLYSKEQILANYSRLLNRIASWLFLVLLIRLTLAYRIKLLSAVIFWSQRTNSNFANLLSTLPILILRKLTILTGWIITSSFTATIMTRNLIYLILLVSGLMIFTKKLGEGFYLHFKFSNNLHAIFNSLKTRRIAILSLLESAIMTAIRISSNKITWRALLLLLIALLFL